MECFPVGSSATAAFLPDGRRAVALSRIGELVLVDLHTGLPLRNFSNLLGPKGADNQKFPWFDLAVFDNGRKVVCARLDGTFSICDIEQGTLVRSFGDRVPNALWTPAVAMATDGHRLIQTRGDYLPVDYVYDLSDGHKFGEFAEPSSPRSAAMTANGALVAIGAREECTLRDGNTFKIIAKLHDHNAPVSAIAFSADGSRMASGDELGFVCLREVRTNRRVAMFKAHTGEVRKRGLSA